MDAARGSGGPLRICVSNGNARGHDGCRRATDISMVLGALCARHHPDSPRQARPSEDRSRAARSGFRVGPGPFELEFLDAVANLIAIEAEKRRRLRLVPAG